MCFKLNKLYVAIPAASRTIPNGKFTRTESPDSS